MSFYDFFKNILGFPNRNTPLDPPSSEPHRGNEFKKPVWIDEYEEEDDDILSQQHGMHTFPVLTDPIEIHRFFEQQMQHMQEMMKSFSMFSPTSIFEDFPSGNEANVFGAIEQPKEDSQNLRDQYLKRPDDPVKNQRKDMDLDSRVNSEGLGKIMDDVTPGNQVTPAIPAPRFRFFGESIVSKTIRKPDGTVETHTTTKRSDGTEETFVSVKRPDGTEDVQTETSLLPRSEVDVFSRRGAQEDFLIDILKGFFRN